MKSLTQNLCLFLFVLHISELDSFLPQILQVPNFYHLIYFLIATHYFLEEAPDLELLMFYVTYSLLWNSMFPYNVTIWSFYLGYLGLTGKYEALMPLLENIYCRYKFGQFRYIMSECVLFLAKNPLVHLLRSDLTILYDPALLVTVVLSNNIHFTSAVLTPFLFALSYLAIPFCENETQLFILPKSASYVTAVLINTLIIAPRLVPSYIYMPYMFYCLISPLYRLHMSVKEERHDKDVATYEVDRLKRIQASLTETYNGIFETNATLRTEFDAAIERNKAINAEYSFLQVLYDQHRDMVKERDAEISDLQKTIEKTRLYLQQSLIRINDLELTHKADVREMALLTESHSAFLKAFNFSDPRTHPDTFLQEVEAFVSNFNEVNESNKRNNADAVLLLQSFRHLSSIVGYIDPMKPTEFAQELVRRLDLMFRHHNVSDDEDEAPESQTEPGRPAQNPFLTEEEPLIELTQDPFFIEEDLPAQAFPKPAPAPKIIGPVPTNTGNSIYERWIRHRQTMSAKYPNRTEQQHFTEYMRSFGVKAELDDPDDMFLLCANVAARATRISDHFKNRLGRERNKLSPPTSLSKKEQEKWRTRHARLLIKREKKLFREAQDPIRPEVPPQSSKDTRRRDFDDAEIFSDRLHEIREVYANGGWDTRPSTSTLTRSEYKSGVRVLAHLTAPTSHGIQEMIEKAKKAASESMNQISSIYSSIQTRIADLHKAYSTYVTAQTALDWIKKYAGALFDFLTTIITSIYVLGNPVVLVLNLVNFLSRYVTFERASQLATYLKQLLEGMFTKVADKATELKTDASAAIADFKKSADEKLQKLDEMKPGEQVKVLLENATSVTQEKFEEVLTKTKSFASTTKDKLRVFFNFGEKKLFPIEDFIPKVSPQEAEELVLKADLAPTPEDVYVIPEPLHPLYVPDGEEDAPISQADNESVPKMLVRFLLSLFGTEVSEEDLARASSLQRMLHPVNSIISLIRSLPDLSVKIFDFGLAMSTKFGWTANIPQELRNRMTVLMVQTNDYESRSPSSVISPTEAKEFLEIYSQMGVAMRDLTALDEVYANTAPFGARYSRLRHTAISAQLAIKAASASPQMRIFNFFGPPGIGKDTAAKTVISLILKRLGESGEPHTIYPLSGTDKFVSSFVPDTHRAITYSEPYLSLATEDLLVAATRIMLWSSGGTVTMDTPIAEDKGRMVNLAYLLACLGNCKTPIERMPIEQNTLGGLARRILEVETTTVNKSYDPVTQRYTEIVPALDMLQDFRYTVSRWVKNVDQKWNTTPVIFKGVALVDIPLEVFVEFAFADILTTQHAAKMLAEAFPNITLEQIAERKKRPTKESDLLYPESSEEEPKGKEKEKKPELPESQTEKPKPSSSDGLDRKLKDPSTPKQKYQDAPSLDTVTFTRDEAGYWVNKGILALPIWVHADMKLFMSKGIRALLSFLRPSEIDFIMSIGDTTVMDTLMWWYEDAHGKQLKKLSTLLLEHRRTNPGTTWERFQEWLARTMDASWQIVRTHWKTIAAAVVIGLTALVGVVLWVGTDVTESQTTTYDAGQISRWKSKTPAQRPDVLLSQSAAPIDYAFPENEATPERIKLILPGPKIPDLANEVLKMYATIELFDPKINCSFEFIINRHCGYSCLIPLHSLPSDWRQRADSIGIHLCEGNTYGTWFRLSACTITPIKCPENKDEPLIEPLTGRKSPNLLPGYAVDMAVCTFPRTQANCAKDRIHHHLCIDELSTRMFSDACVVSPLEKPGPDGPIRVPGMAITLSTTGEFLDKPVKTSNSPYITTVAFKLPLPSAPGQCNLTAISTNPRLPKILGYHTAGHTGKDSIYAIIYQEILRAFTPAPNFTIVPADLVSQASYGVKLDKLPLGAEYIGTVPDKLASYIPDKTSIIPTRIDLDYEPESVPALLKNYHHGDETFSPMKEVLSRFQTHSMPSVQSYYEQSMHLIVDEMVKNARPINNNPGQKFGILTLDEVVRGSDYVYEPSPMKASTSSGYENRHLGPGKSAFIETTPTGNVPTPLFRQYWKEYDDALREGKLLETVSNFFFKDEGRPIAKTLPANVPHNFPPMYVWNDLVHVPKRTRGVINPDIRATTAFSVYLENPMAALYHGAKWSMVGINMTSSQFYEMLQKHFQMSGPIFMTDVSNNDLTKTNYELTVACDLLFRACSIITDSDEQTTRIREILAYSWHHHLILMRNVLFRTNCIIASGAWGTTKIGQIINLAKFNAALATLIHTKLPAVTDPVKLAWKAMIADIYGDDQFTTLHHSLNWVSGPMLQLTLIKQYGNKLTGDDHSDTVEAISPDRIRPLGRTLSPFTNMGMLSASTIKEIPLWRWDNDIPDSLMLPTLCDTALREWYHHGPDTFKQWKKTYDLALKKRNLPCTSVTLPECRKLFL